MEPNCDRMQNHSGEDIILAQISNQTLSFPNLKNHLLKIISLQPIDSHTDVSYQVSAEAVGGAISTRDFVNVRHWGHVDEGDDRVYVSAGVSVTHPAMPPQPKRVR